jgi:hypothetical protein
MAFLDVAGASRDIFVAIFPELGDIQGELMPSLFLAPAAWRWLAIVCHKEGMSEPAKLGQLRADLDGLIAHRYDLTEEEFPGVMSTFPLAADPVKLAAQNAYRDEERGLIE